MGIAIGKDIISDCSEWYSFECENTQFQMILRLISEFALYVPVKSLVFCVKHLASPKDVVDER